MAAAAASRAGEPMKSWTKGDRVVQPTYGPGTLVEVNEHHTVIDFDEHGRRTFATRLVTLQSTNEPAPNKPVRKRATKAKAKEPKAAKEPKETKASKEAKAKD
ncbi:MAG: hypothetical protein GEU82_05775 [Luteitalea sp.]|nr:hypothetical protein [Luteitalea sp.]